jgi:hypothetical protein
MIDYAVFRWPPLQSAEFKTTKAMVDSMAHGVIAGWSCAHVLLWQPDIKVIKGGALILIGVATSIAVDFDHFIEAGSLDIQDALTLSRRPFAHNSLMIIPLILFIISLLLLFATSSGPLHLTVHLKLLPLIVFLSVSAHHLRDADRRGVWLGFLSTPPIPCKLYIMTIVCLSLLMRYLIN